MNLRWIFVIFFLGYNKGVGAVDLISGDEGAIDLESHSKESTEDIDTSQHVNTPTPDEGTVGPQQHADAEPNAEAAAASSPADQTPEELPGDENSENANLNEESENVLVNDVDPDVLQEQVEKRGVDELLQLAVDTALPPAGYDEHASLQEGAVADLQEDIPVVLEEAKRVDKNETRAIEDGAGFTSALVADDEVKQMPTVVYQLTGNYDEYPPKVTAEGEVKNVVEKVPVDVDEVYTGFPSGFTADEDEQKPTVVYQLTGNYDEYPPKVTAEDEVKNVVEKVPVDVDEVYTSFPSGLADDILDLFEEVDEDDAVESVLKTRLPSTTQQETAAGSLDADLAAILDQTRSTGDLPMAIDEVYTGFPSFSGDFEDEQKIPAAYVVTGNYDDYPPMYVRQDDGESNLRGKGKDGGDKDKKDEPAAKGGSKKESKDGEPSPEEEKDEENDTKDSVSEKIKAFFQRVYDAVTKFFRNMVNYFKNFDIKKEFQKVIDASSKLFKGDEKESKKKTGKSPGKVRRASSPRPKVKVSTRTA